MLNRSCSGRERGYAATPTGCVTSQATGCDSPLARLLPRGRWIEFLPITPRRYWPGTANWQRSLRHLTQWQNESSKRDMIGHSMVGQCGFGLQLSMNCAAAQDAVSGPCRDLDEMAGPDAGGMHNLACRALSVRSAAGRALLIAVRPSGLLPDPDGLARSGVERHLVRVDDPGLEPELGRPSGTAALGQARPGGLAALGRLLGGGVAFGGVSGRCGGRAGAVSLAQWIERLPPK